MLIKLLIGYTSLVFISTNDIDANINVRYCNVLKKNFVAITHPK